MTIDRIDTYPTHNYQGHNIRAGRVYPFGASRVPGGVNFSVFSRYATDCTLVLFERGAKEPFAEIPFPDDFRIGNVYTMIVFDLDYEMIEYGFRMDGPFDPRHGHRFDKEQILLDPYARVIGGRDVWLNGHDHDDIYPHRARISYDDFDWQHDLPLETPIEDLIIYEMHVRSFTAHESSGVKQPGTYAAIIEKIPYLKELGVNAIELMPVFEFDEYENTRINPMTGEPLVNYWGYSSVGFFAPKAGYAATGVLGMQVDEFKNLVKELHANGIEIILDVVFNHTAEGNEEGPTISFRGIDNKTYYMLTPDGKYFNFSGTGNTLNCNNPIVRGMILDCLRYWAAEYHIDGFRFDLAAILGRDPLGYPLPNPPLLETLAYDPVLAHIKLIAEAWDAGGLYQVGTFPSYGRWAEWNGKYRDAVRKFIKSDENIVGEIGQRVQGSPDLYYGRGPTASINFITAHDGFTMRDLMSYNHKHNYANGEDNRDGTDDNHSWNCGVEGETDDPDILNLRARQVKNAFAVLLTSIGVPMILMGDEMGRTKQGNNNTYCHDNDLNWLDWSLLQENEGLFNFVKGLINFRRVHPVLRRRTHFVHQDVIGSGYPDISFHGTKAWQPNWARGSRTLAFMLDGSHSEKGQDDFIYVAMNFYWEGLAFELPKLPVSLRWHIVANTYMAPPHDIHPLGQEPVHHGRTFVLGARSVIILVGR